MRAMSFDRAAGYYDATRALPGDVLAALAGILAAELAAQGPCLEIGVGTGRIALPLHERGVRLVGADVAPAMLRRLVANAGGRQPFPLLIADATRLPVASAALVAVMASHVLHLISDWRAAVDEAMRVLAPGGVLLADFGGAGFAPWGRACEEVMRRRGIVRIRPGVSAPGTVAAHLAGRAAVRPLAPVTMTVRRTLREDLESWEQQTHSWTWPYSPEQMRAACAGVRAWAAGQGWPLDREAQMERTIQWWAFERSH